MLKSLKQVRAALALLNPAEVRRMAARPVHIGLVASSESGYSEMEDFLLAKGGPRRQVHRADDPGTPDDVGIVIYESGVSNPVGGYTFAPDADGWIGAALDDHPEMSLALGSQFPALRPHVIGRTIQEIARENAFFAVATALPNVVPSLIELPWVIGEFATDTAFLTANQIRMAFLIAAACGRESGFSRQMGPILTIAGGAFGWRALARELAGKIPLGGGLIPKGAIAYAGTFLVGKALEHYYRTNRVLTRAEREEVYQDGYRRGREVAQSLDRKPA